MEGGSVFARTRKGEGLVFQVGGTAFAKARRNEGAIQVLGPAHRPGLRMRMCGGLWVLSWLQAVSGASWVGASGPCAEKREGTSWRQGQP